MYAVIRVRGTSNIPKKVKDTLDILKLTKPHHCVVFPETEICKGMLQKVKDKVTWGEISEKTLEELVSKRGRLEGRKTVESKDVRKIIDLLKKGNKKDISIKPVFRLSPPRKGFEKKGVKKSFMQGGAVGYRGEKINDLILRMI